MHGSYGSSHTHSWAPVGLRQQSYVHWTASPSHLVSASFRSSPDLWPHQVSWLAVGPGFPQSWSKGMRGKLWSDGVQGMDPAPLTTSSLSSQSWGHPGMVGTRSVALGLTDQSHLLAQGHRAMAWWIPNCATCWTDSSSSMASSSRPCS